MLRVYKTNDPEAFKDDACEPGKKHDWMVDRKGRYYEVWKCRCCKATVRKEDMMG